MNITMGGYCLCKYLVKYVRLETKKKQRLEVFYKCNEWIKKSFVVGGDLRSLTLTTNTSDYKCVCSAEEHSNEYLFMITILNFKLSLRMVLYIIKDNIINCQNCITIKTYVR